jgi:endonuclease/exonuclease/phosphatase family metal-dependent hydrolase
MQYWRNPNSLKYVQGFVTQWLGLASVLWYTSMSFQLFKFIVHKKSPLRIRKKLKRHFAGIIVVSLIIAIILLGAGAYGDAEIYCWIRNDGPNEALRWFAFYFIVVCCWVYAFSCLSYTGTSIRSYSSEGGLPGSHVIQRKIVQYMIVFVFTWFFGLANRAASYFAGHAIYTTSVLESISIPLQGFLNAACYGGFFDCWSSRTESADNDDDVSLVSNEKDDATFEGSKEVELRESSHQPAGPRSDRSNTKTRIESTDVARTTKLHDLIYRPKQYSVFTTTYNVGEAPTSEITAHLKDWILAGHDIYAIGVQECIDLKGLREHILQHLGGPEEFVMYGVEIGSNRTNLGYHGFIALTCYIRASEIKSGRIRPIDSASNTMATGTNLIVTTAQNKGAVGLLFQVHDTSIGFVTAHLPSDSKGKSKLAKRNASIDAILKEVILAPEDTGFDLHLQHDHIVLMGDLNYRMDTARTAKEGVGESILTNVAEAGAIQKSVLNDDSYWVGRKYNLLRSKKTDKLYPGEQELKLLQQSMEDSRAAWETVLQTDELRYIMKYKGVFTGFEEPLPAFPPSYKRKKGQTEADCGDYTDALDILRGFTNTGEVDVEEISNSPLFAVNIKTTAATVMPTNRLRRNTLMGNNNALAATSSSSSMRSIIEEGDEENEDEETRQPKAEDVADEVMEPMVYYPPKKSVVVQEPEIEPESTTTQIVDTEISAIVGPGGVVAATVTTTETETVNPSTPTRAKKAVSVRMSDDPVGESAPAAVGSPESSPTKKPKKKVGISFGDVPSGESSSSVAVASSVDVANGTAVVAIVSESSSSPVVPSLPMGDVSPSSSSAGLSGRQVTPRSKRRQSTLVAIAPTNAKETKKFRPPSYTDRILYHSLPDRKHRLLCQGYDFCDDMRASDHRPVTMVLNLEANAAFSCEGASSTGSRLGGSSRRLGDSSRPASGGSTASNNSISATQQQLQLLRQAPDSSSTSSSQFSGSSAEENEPIIYLNDSIELYELVISQLQVNIVELAADADAESEASGNDDVSMLVDSLNIDLEAGEGLGGSPLTSKNLSVKRTPAMNSSNNISISRNDSNISITRTDSNVSTMTASSVASSSAGSGVSKKGGKGKKAHDLAVDDVLVVFPLPAKDPLIAERKMYDFARAFNLNSNSMIK